MEQFSTSESGSLGWPLHNCIKQTRINLRCSLFLNLIMMQFSISESGSLGWPLTHQTDKNQSLLLSILNLIMGQFSTSESGSLGWPITHQTDKNQSLLLSISKSDHGAIFYFWIRIHGLATNAKTCIKQTRIINCCSLFLNLIMWQFSAFSESGLLGWPLTPQLHQTDKNQSLLLSFSSLNFIMGQFFCIFLIGIHGLGNNNKFSTHDDI